MSKLTKEEKEFKIYHKCRWEHLRTEYGNTLDGSSSEIELVICHGCGRIKEMIREKGYYIRTSNTTSLD